MVSSYMLAIEETECPFIGATQRASLINMEVHGSVGIVLFQLVCIFLEPLVMPLLRAIVVPTSMDEICFIELPEGRVLL